MILKQVFKTLDGASKRCAFENAHSKGWRFSLRWFSDGVDVTDDTAYKASSKGVKHWQIEKTKRRAG